MEQQSHEKEDPPTPVTYLVIKDDHVIREIMGYNHQDAKTKVAVAGLIGTLALVIES